MSDLNQAINALQEAFAITPQNTPLRLHLIQLLCKAQRFAEAEQLCRAGLADHPEHQGLKYELALIFYLQDKASASIVILESLCQQSNTEPKARILYARVLLRIGEFDNAVAHYRSAITDDPSVADQNLAEQLGIADNPDNDPKLLRATYENAPNDRLAVEIERPKCKFSDVGGMEHVKEEISLKIIMPLKYPDLYKSYGKVAGGGILLYGPPGCGKTHLARATAGEIEAGFISIGINDVLDMYIGNSEKNLHEVFDQARSNRPCVLFFDEVDALGGKRNDQSAAARNIVNQFLSEMDGINTRNEGILILAATNAPWQVDAAFRRPGRFDRVVFIPPPDQAARLEILEVLCRGKPCENLDLSQIAAKTEHFSGADLKAIVDVTIENKLRQALKSGGLKPITTSDLLNAIKTLKPTTREWFATAKNYALYSNQAGTYDDVLKYLKLA